MFYIANAAHVFVLTDEGRTFPNSKDLRKKVKKSPKRHMFRREATMMVDSSSEEFSDKEQHIQ